MEPESHHLRGPDAALDGRRSRSMSLAPIPDRKESLAALQHRLSVELGPDVDQITAQKEDLIHQVEHMDTVINAHASVVAEGIRPHPLSRRPSAIAIDGLRSFFRVNSQPSAAVLEELMPSIMNIVRPFSPSGSLEREDHIPHLPVHITDEHTNTNRAASFASKLAMTLRKVHPQEDGVLSQGSFSAQHPPPISEDDANGNRNQTPSPKADQRESNSRRGGTKTSEAEKTDEKKSPRLSRRRSSVNSIADGVQSLARSTSKLRDKLHHEAMDELRQAKVAELMEKDVMVLNESQLAQMQQRNTHPFTIPVNSSFRHWWDLAITLSIAYEAVAMPIKVGFQVDAKGFGYVLDVLVDLIYLAEIVLNFFTSYIDETSGEEVKNIKQIRKNYLSGFFLLDALSSIPFSFVSTAPSQLPLLKILKVTRAIKISKTGLIKTLSSRVNRSMNPSLLRMMELTFIFFISQHFIACTYYFISLNQDHFTTWQPPPETRNSSLVQQYIYAIYFAIMVTTANDVSPTTSTEQVFTSVMLFVGIVINASIIGSAANLLSNLDKAEIARKNQMDSINDYMRFKKVPLVLQEKIRRYYEYALNSRVMDPTETLFVELPDRLKLSLRLNLHDEFIRKVPLFRVCSNAGVIAIVQCLKQVVAMPHEVIIAQGEIANDFYFIKSGQVSLCVRTAAQEVPLGNLGEGSFFGECSLLTGEPQQAEVRSDSVIELAFLTKDDFMAIIDKFPTFFLAVRRISENRMQTAHNVQRMARMQRRQSHPHVPMMTRKMTFKRAAEAVLPTVRINKSVRSAAEAVLPTGRINRSARSAGRKVSEIVHGTTQGSGNERNSGLTQRFTSSRRHSNGGLFSANYLERMSLGQARHLTNLRAIEQLRIDSSTEDPLWN